MKRQVTMEEISDGKLYTSNDLVKADCGDCEGCHACCTGMGSSIVLDPLDIVRIRLRKEDVGFIHFVRESAGFSHLEDIMRKRVSAISFRYMNVRKRTGRK